MKKAQFWVIFLLLSSTVTLMYLRGDKDRVPPSQPLSGMPQGIGTWTSEDIPINQDVLDVLGHGVFLNRVYKAEGSDAAVQTAASSAEIGLFIGYFPTQRTGQSIHSPQNCLPGSGWTFEKSGVTELTDDAGKTIRIGEYVISDGTSKDEVLYWYQSHGRSIASDYAAKLYMLVDSIRYERTDAALVRIITPIRRGEEVSVAHVRAVDFVKRLSPLLPRYIPD